MSDLDSDPVITPFTVIVDTSEQAPWTFEGITEKKTRQVKGEKIPVFSPVIVKALRRHLKTGDYSIEGFEDKISIERKSIPDFVSTITGGRERFVRELERSRSFEFFAVIVEGSLEEVLRYARDETQAGMSSIYRSIISFEIDFLAHFIFEPSRAAAEKRAFLTLKQFHKRRSSR